ncbi:hypothetical protein CLV98_103355 [Dyadobacter jejuensis]|uniref:Activator of Hsp90 ATPase-like protein n=1 Tax=Dyadobacter jejuensis TaxID=1082580 RepID=A0A316AN65_9BACT|nr:hypothetical protein [Dyadobacter jejuensis]PWJ58982.1 hypothetical protein CLV98_103355 [Dyadobacter jejuensis]
MRLRAITEMYIYKPQNEVLANIINSDKLIAYFKLYNHSLQVNSDGYIWHKPDKTSVTIRLKSPQPPMALSFDWDFTNTDTQVQISVQQISPSLSLLKIVEDGWTATDEGISRYNKQIKLWSFFSIRFKLYLEHGLKV